MRSSSGAAGGMTLGSGLGPERRTQRRSTIPDGGGGASAHWDFDPSAESPMRAKPNESDGNLPAVSRPRPSLFAGLSLPGQRQGDSLRIVVSPVRVRVSPSREVPASSPLSRGHRLFRVSGGAPRMRANPPTASGRRPTKRSTRGSARSKASSLLLFDGCRRRRRQPPHERSGRAILAICDCSRTPMMTHAAMTPGTCR
jgi:hypothetical protein